MALKRRVVQPYRRKGTVKVSEIRRAIEALRRRRLNEYRQCMRQEKNRVAAHS
jgi:transcription initiation factor IIE alpha subunit